MPLVYIYIISFMSCFEWFATAFLSPYSIFMLQGWVFFVCLVVFCYHVASPYLSPQSGFFWWPCSVRPSDSLPESLQSSCAKTFRFFLSAFQSEIEKFLFQCKTVFSWMIKDTWTWTAFINKCSFIMLYMQCFERILAFLNLINRFFFVLRPNNFSSFPKSCTMIDVNFSSII